MSSLSIFHYNKVWEQELDSFGRKRRKDNNNSSFIPFKYQGQYEDVETGLYYNRFRYYDPNAGSYISQDPIGLAGDNPTLYAYVSDVNYWNDVLGLTAEAYKLVATKDGYYDVYDFDEYVKEIYDENEAIEVFKRGLEQIKLIRHDKIPKVKKLCEELREQLDARKLFDDCKKNVLKVRD